MLMQTSIFVSILLVCAVTSPTYFTMFNKFKETYFRKYESVQEEQKRFNIFVSNMEKAAVLQRANPFATFGVNEFADLSDKEFKSRHNAEKQFATHLDKDVITYSAQEMKEAAGQSIDWRKKGAVTQVKNQGQCGSCWAFSTTGGIEGQWFLAGNSLTSLSEQELVSCDTIDNACNGGLMDNAFTWLIGNTQGNIVTESSYPYVSGGGDVPSCASDLNSKPVGATITAYRNIASNEDSMAAFVYKSGPLSIGVDASSWQTYTGGIMTNCISQSVDHGVLIVGFNTVNSPPYWIIKNSWGPDWGENGYIRVEKGTDQCLLTTFPCTSIVAKNTDVIKQ